MGCRVQIWVEGFFFFGGGGGEGGVRLKPGLFGSWHLGFLLPN